MPSHVHMIIGSNKNKLEDIIRDMKKQTSSKLGTAIKSNVTESRKEWMNWMFERAGKKMAIMTADIQMFIGIGSNTIKL